MAAHGSQRRADMARAKATARATQTAPVTERLAQSASVKCAGVALSDPPGGFLTRPLPKPLLLRGRNSKGRRVVPRPSNRWANQPEAHCANGTRRTPRVNLSSGNRQPDRQKGP